MNNPQTAPPWRPTDRYEQAKNSGLGHVSIFEPGMSLYDAALAAKRRSSAMTNYANVKDEQLDVLFPSGHTLEAVTELHKSLCAEALALVSKKGADYNRSEQQNGDTLANLKMSAKMGLVETPAHGVLVRLLDKLMRLKSLCKPGEKPANVDEKVRDTVVDVINYAVYVLALTEGANV